MSAAQHKYLLDANVFIEAHRRYYAFDICPGFWNCMLYHSQESVIYSIDKVRDELKTGDKLEQWIKDNVSKSMFNSTSDVAVMENFSQMMQYVQNSTQYNPEAKAEFAQVADGWLIAYAKEHGHILVTHEALNLTIKRKVPMPNLCEYFKVPYVDTFKMLRDLNAQFNW